ncbi:hypothetical protein A2160_05700 [Candidatus Beckwithbacteria bacterium RBG_13_42_9]|uniref:Uncharacterized protein n=1 Tax=Candidatus Beckwithbacteria bacterium RBG_13_42_9 TaxID=1797457 RepID=A0A1F5E694_9BACT|nr:MAG: hypothetical protein A2160_05700 [Candidatus Beckwithbacteria bacterium RBG_13_42_9]
MNTKVFFYYTPFAHLQLLEQLQIGLAKRLAILYFLCTHLAIITLILILFLMSKDKLYSRKISYLTIGLKNQAHQLAVIYRR